MKQLIAILAAVCFFAAAAPAHEYKNYIGVKGGYEWSKETYDSRSTIINNIPTYLDGGVVFSGKGITMGAFAGLYFNNRLRGEIAYHYKQLEDPESRGIFLNSGHSSYDVYQHTFLANMFFYPLNKMTVTPFIGAGAGGALTKIENSDIKGGFAYAFYIGADYDFYDEWTIDLTAAYTSTVRPYNDANNIHNFGISLGLRYNY